MNLDPIRVNVTQENIDNGEHRTCCADPLALAIKAEKDIEVASVHWDDGHFILAKRQETEVPSNIEGNPPVKRVSVEKFVYRFKLPKDAQKFVQQWERREKVAPFEFTIEPKFWAKNTGNATVPNKADVEAKS